MALRKILAEVLDLSEKEINDDLHMARCESWDSLTHMNLIAELEERYAIELSAEDIVQMVNVIEIERIISRKTTN